MSPFVNDPDFVLHVGDALQVLATMPDESVHCVVTSPPYWGLRDYGTGSWEGGDDGCDHAPVSGLQGTSEASQRADRSFTGSKPQGQVCSRCGARRVDHQLGLEPTPEEYVTSMVAVFREVRRVLRRDGTCWLNIGDSYAASPSGNHEKQRDRQRQDGAFTVPSWEHRTQRWDGTATDKTRGTGLKPKDLVGIPWRLAFALQADGWYLRSDIIWSKPNPMPESVTDRPTKAHEYLFLLTKSARYFYDADAIREPLAAKTLTVREGPTNYAYANDGGGHVKTANWNNSVTERWHNHAGANKRTVWEIATEAYPDAHFATFPQALVEPCVLAGTSERGCCPVCGAPWERETETGYEPTTRTPAPNKGHIGAFGERAANMTRDGFVPNREKRVETTGWNDACECGRGGRIVRPVPCTVLDPFMGSGTVAVVARRLGRRAVGIELNPEYALLASKRLAQLSLLAA